MESESVDFVPAEFVDMELDKISSSSPNPLNQRMRVELEGSTVFHGVVVDPVDQLRVLNDSGQRVVVRIANICWCFRQTELQSLVHCDEDVLLFVLGLTSNFSDLESDFNQDGKWSQDVLAGVVERLFFPVFALVEGIELVRPLDPDLVLVGDVNLFVTLLVLISFGVVTPNILSAKLDSGLLGGRSDKSD